MSGHFENGKWVEDGPVLKYVQDNTSRPIDHHPDILREYQRVINYYKRDAYRYRELTFYQRLIFLFFPRTVIRGR